MSKSYEILKNKIQTLYPNANNQELDLMTHNLIKFFAESCKALNNVKE